MVHRRAVSVPVAGLEGRFNGELAAAADSEDWREPEFVQPPEVPEAIYDVGGWPGLADYDTDEGDDL